MLTAADLLKHGRHDELWQRHCGFFDLSVDEFMAIQERLLTEQLQLLAGSELGRKIVGGEVPSTPKEFLRVAPFTTYSNYLPYLPEKLEDMLPAKPVCWMRTSGKTSQYRGKWVPVSAQYYSSLARETVTCLTLASAKKKGDIALELDATLLYAAAPPPYISGTGIRASGLEFPFCMVPPTDEAEKMSFQERVQQGFLLSMGSGIDYIMGVASVLMRIGEAFSGGTRQMSFSPALLRPQTIYRLSKAWLASRLNGRPMLPKDIWRPKGIVASGMDAQMYRPRIKELWGCDPLEMYACTEFGPIAHQAWGERKQGMTLMPNSAYWEFMPETEYRLWQQRPSYRPRTLLLNELQTGKYVLVGTSLEGGAFVRYVIGDLLRVIALEDADLGIRLPQIVVESRVDEVINLASMVVLTERALWQALSQLDVGTVDWIARKEFDQGDKHPILHMYMEGTNLDGNRLVVDLDNALIETDEEYADFRSILEVNPLRISLFTPGTLQAYMKEKEAEGADLGQLKPPRMQPPPEVFERLRATSDRLARTGK